MHERIVAQNGSPVWFRSWAEKVEPTALVVHSWDPLLVPGLLQIDTYARHVLSQEPRIRAEEVEERVEARTRRRSMANR